jgi:hypothetical protein
MRPEDASTLEETLLANATLDDDATRPDLSHLWTPQPGPQTLAYHSKADLLFYGGAAGGGKSDLLLGLSLTQHQRSIIYRKEATQNQDFVERLTSDLLKTDRGWSSKNMTWNLTQVTRFRGQRIVFGGLPNPGDEQRYKGRPNDFIGFDEGVDFTEHQIRFLSTWNRSTLPGQRCRVVVASNPPAPTAKKQAASGLWLIDMFAPWLDPQYKDPLGLGRPEPGELRWYVRLPGHTRDQEWPDGVPFLHPDPNDSNRLQPVIPKSRTFIPASVYDNAFLRGTQYLGTLQSLPEPLRSIMLRGDFTQALSDQPAALFPAQWVRDAVERWRAVQDIPRTSSQHPANPTVTPMTALGFDVARGGADYTIGAPRYGSYFDTLHVVPGTSTPDGPSAAGYAVAWVRDGATIVVDANGPGGSAYDHLYKTLQVRTRAYVGSTKAVLRDRTGKFTFPNLRSQAYWKFREALDPATPGLVYLPDDPELIKELLAHTYEPISGGKIQVIAKEKIVEALGRSPDRADAVVMAWTEPHESSWLPAQGNRGDTRRRASSGRYTDDEGRPPPPPAYGPIDDSYYNEHVI